MTIKDEIFQKIIIPYYYEIKSNSFQTIKFFDPSTGICKNRRIETALNYDPLKMQYDYFQKGKKLQKLIENTGDLNSLYKWTKNMTFTSKYGKILCDLYSINILTSTYDFEILPKLIEIYKT